MKKQLSRSLYHGDKKIWSKVAFYLFSESSTSSSTVVVTTSQITSTTTTGISPVTAATSAFKPVSAETTTSISTETSSSTSTEWLSSSCSSPSAEPITPELEKLRKSSCSISNLIVEKIKAGRTSNPINVKIVEKIFSQQDFAEFFPRANSAYTYENFLKAVGKFPSVCSELEICKRTLATMFAHFQQETSGLYYLEEIAKADYCATWSGWVRRAYPCSSGNQQTATRSGSPPWQRLGNLKCLQISISLSSDLVVSAGPTGCFLSFPLSFLPLSIRQVTAATCLLVQNLVINIDWAARQSARLPARALVWINIKLSQGKQYYGRGAKQLTWNYNYGAFSVAMYGKPSILLEQPELVSETWLNFASAIWFFVTPQPPKPSMLHVIDGTWQPNSADSEAGISPGFGATINVINGGYECGAAGNNKQSQNRENYYKKYCKTFALDCHTERTDCAHMGKFSASGSANPPIYWEPLQDCKLVMWQTAFSALIEGQHRRCEESLSKTRRLSYYLPAILSWTMDLYRNIYI